MQMARLIIHRPKSQLLVNFVIIIIRMSRKLKYRIISCSSEQNNHPASSLLFPTPEGWQTKRFCSYPQQITIEFYGIVHIDKLQLISDSRKIASSVQILYFLPTELNNQNRFMKYGFMSFNRNQNANVREQKTLMVDFKCLFIRLLFNKPHKSKENFFSQVGLHELKIYGSEGGATLPLEVSTKDQYMLNGNKNYQQEDAWIYERLMNLNAKKQKAIQQEDYQEANINKLMMDNIKKFGYKIRKMQQQKKKAIEDEDFDKAKVIKENIDRCKQQVEQVLSDPQYQNNENNRQTQHRQIQNDPNDNQFVDGMNEYLNKQNTNTELHYSRKIKGNQSYIQQGDPQLQLSMFSKKKKAPDIQSSYDQRVIPALTNKQKTEQDLDQNQQVQKKNFQLEQVDGKYLKDASLVEEHFNKQTSQKLFSKHWQHKTEGLATIQAAVQSKANSAAFIKCMLNVVQHTIKQTNFQIVQHSLNILLKTLNANAKSNLIQKSNDINTQLSRIMQQLIKKLGDNNQKIKQNAQKCFDLTIHSNLYGAEACSIQLMKSKGKVATKLLCTKLNRLTKIVSQAGIGNPNSASIGVIDFAFQQLQNPSSQVRTASIHLIAVCAIAIPEKVDPKLEGIKASIQQQILKKQQQIKGGGVANNGKKKKR